ncbi:unnamed protein product [Paramecium sonneborni]|uniref:Uncharacterized protein n=1 Tax=Paramecium sonneborni TaxID=65129 RepID=A0A8S1MHP0_9CILI|nr:unnamed protein product [Paramecium sonneborni]
MAKEVQFVKLNSPNNIKKQNQLFCINPIGILNSNQIVKDPEKCDDKKQSHENLIKKYHVQLHASIPTNQSQKTLISKTENFTDKINTKINNIKTKEKENNVFRQHKYQDTKISNHLIRKEKSCFKILQNSKNCDKQEFQQIKVLSINNTLMDKKGSDSNILLPLSSLVRKSQKQKNQPQLLQMNSNALILKDQIAGQDYPKQKSQSQQEMYRSVQEELEDTLIQEEVINQKIKQSSSQFIVKQFFFSLAHKQEGSQENKTKTSNIQKGLNLSQRHLSKSTRAHTQGRQEQIQINKLYEYILEGNY